MNIETLSNFLAQLAKPVALLDSTPDVSGQLGAVSSALAPFGNQELSEFAGFLQHAEQQRASGAIPVDPPGLGSVRQALEALHVVLKSQDTNEVGRLQSQLGAALVALGASVGLKFAAPKADPKWIETFKSHAEIEAAVKKLQALAPQIETVEALEEESIRHDLDGLAALPPTVLKAAAVEVGADPAKKKGRDLVLAALARITKLPLDVKPKKGKAKAAGADDGTVLQITSELKEMAVRATKPDAVSDAEIEEMLTKVEGSRFSDRQMKEIAFAVTGVKEKSKAKALLALRGKLTAAKRGLEGQKA